MTQQEKDELNAELISDRREYELNDLLLALRRYKAAYEAAQRCPDMILSSGRTEESIRLMQELEDARIYLSTFC